MSIDLSGAEAGAENPAQAAGRVVGGVVLMIIGGVVALGFLAAYLLGWLVPAIADWVELLEDLLLIPAGIGLAIAVIGFELVRRTRKVRAREAAEAAQLTERLRATGALDGTATPESVAHVFDEPTGDLETRL
jgi:hypothetical protein